MLGELPAARLLGSADALRDALNARLDRFEQGLHDEAVATLRTTLGESAFAESWELGRSTPVEETVAAVLSG